MDEFGVLVESMGFKAQGKSSAPLAHLKATTKTNSNSNTSKSDTSFYVDDLDGIFRSNSNPPTSSSALDDVFGGFKPSSSNNNDDVFGLTNTRSDDFLAGIPISSNLINNSPDLLSKGRKTEASPGAKSFSASAQDPFVMFETPPQGSSSSSYNGASVVVVDDYLDSLFPRSNGQTPPTTQDSVYDALFSNHNFAAPKQQKKKESSKQPNPNSSDGDFSYLFGMGVSPPSSGQFQEIDGESEERRKARFNHHITTRERMNNALREKNKRDQQAQREQDEKHRVATTLDGDIKRWAVGKEGNLRALLSSLQHVLWDGSGWQAISLTDLITSTAVKKAYYKATLCVHPDKVQQKGASVEQKYIAEKVFDVLKEAWNKFNAEEFKKR